MGLQIDISIRLDGLCPVFNKIDDDLFDIVGGGHNERKVRVRGKVDPDVGTLQNGFGKDFGDICQ